MGKDVETYLYLQFKDHINRVDLNKLQRKESPELELMADFVVDKLPHGMCYFWQRSNKLYMVGGERTQRYRSGTSEYSVCDPLSDGPDALSRDVYVLDSSTGKISADPAPDIPKPNGPKLNARVLATIEGKVYVMSTRPHYFGDRIPSPAFECFDTIKQSWEVLQVPPCFNCANLSQRRSTTGLHFFVGPKIYLCTKDGFYRYYVHDPDPKWEFIVEAKWRFTSRWVSRTLRCPDSESESESESEDDDNNLDSPVPMSPVEPYRSICFANPEKGGLAVGYTEKGLVGYFFSESGDLCYQELLHQLNGKIPPPDERLFGGKLCNAGENKFCLILSGRIDGISWSLAVATFDVKWKAADGRRIHFYHDLDLCCHSFDNIPSRSTPPPIFSRYPFMRDRLYDYRSFQDAFVISSESKSHKGKHGWMDKKAGSASDHDQNQQRRGRGRGGYPNQGTYKEVLMYYA